MRSPRYLALTVYAIYKQTQRHEVIGKSRFKLAIIYGIGSLLLSVVVGLARGARSRVGADLDRRVYSQGTALTIALFVLLVASKFAIGTACYFWGISDDGGFGDVLLMIAIMVAFQAQIIWRRARPLGARESREAPTAKRVAAPVTSTR